MTAKKRRTKNPSAWKRKPKAIRGRTVTEATKAKLPRPKRKRKATPPTPQEGDAVYDESGNIKRVWHNGKWADVAPLTASDILAIREKAKAEYESLRDELTSSPIAGQPLDGIGSETAADFRAIPCGEDVGLPMSGVVDPDGVIRLRIHRTEEDVQAMREAMPVPPPDTSAYPWGLKFAWWLDGVPTRVRRWLAARLRWLAGKVMP